MLPNIGKGIFIYFVAKASLYDERWDLEAELDLNALFSLLLTTDGAESLNKKINK